MSPPRPRFSPLRLIVPLPTIAAGLLGGLSLAVCQEIPATELILEVRVTLWRNPSVANNPRLADLTVHWPQ